MTNQAWSIYYNDAVAKAELTQSPARVKWAKEQGHRVVELVEKDFAALYSAGLDSFRKEIIK